MTTPKLDWKTFIDSSCRTKTGGLNNRCASPTWWEPQALNFLYEDTDFMPATSSIMERMYVVYHNLSSLPVCLTCSSAVEFKQFKSGYREYCSLSCSLASATRVNKIQRTTNERYGKTRDKVVQKIKETNQQKYGVDYSTQTDSMKRKAAETKLLKYGDSTYNNIKQAILTNKERYGVNYTTQVPEVQQKMRSTIESVYGNKWVSQQHLSDGIISQLADMATLVQRNQEGESIQEIAESLGVTYRTIYLKFKNIQYQPIWYAPSPITKPHAEILNLLDSCRVEYIVNNRTIIAPKELDIYIPSLSLAIEYHGGFWHSFNRPETKDEKERHQKKFLLCSTKDIRLIQIFEHEWTTQRHLCEQLILRAIRGGTNVCGARTATIVYPSRKETYDFLETHHLKGSVPYSHSVGLRHQNGELLMVMTFGKTRYGSLAPYELLRMVSHTDWHVNGGAQKLWKTAYNQWFAGQKVLTYSDNSLFTGKTFDELGFVITHVTPPSYGYLSPLSEYYSRIRCQKHKLHKLLPVVDINLTEAENMFANGYRRLWNAGHTCWVFAP